MDSPDRSPLVQVSPTVTVVPVDDEAVAYDDASFALHHLGTIGWGVLQVVDGRTTEAEVRQSIEELAGDGAAAERGAAAFDALLSAGIVERADERVGGDG